MKMSLRTWLLGIVITILGGANAGLVFSFIEARFVAAMVAGAGFLIVGAYLATLVWVSETPKKWCTFYTSHIHIFAVSFPMIFVRVLNPDVPFAELSVFGLAGPQFHQVSTYFYQVMLMFVVIDTVRFYTQSD